MRPNDIRARSAQLGSRRIDQRAWQIGPRIRVGGTLGKVGQNVKIAVGKAAANPLVDSALALIPGVGPGVSAAANAMGHVLDTSGGGIHTAGDIGKMALGAGESYLGGKAANGVRDAVMKHLMSTAAGAAVGKVGGGGGAPPATDASGQTEDQFYDSIPGTTGYKGGADDGGILGTAKRVGGNVLGAFTGGNGPGKGRGGLVDSLLLGGSVAASAADQKRKRDLQNRSMDYATQSFDSRAPLRAQGMAQLQDQSTPDLSDVFSDPGNAYSRPRTPATTTPPTLGPRMPTRRLSALS